MSPLDHWRQLAADENAKMREFWDDDADQDRFHLSLHARRAEVVRLRDAGMTTPAIAEFLGMNVSTVRVDLYRARKA